MARFLGVKEGPKGLAGSRVPTGLTLLGFPAGHPQGLQDHDGTGQSHLQERALCSPGRQREKVGAGMGLVGCPTPGDTGQFWKHGLMGQG